MQYVKRYETIIPPNTNITVLLILHRDVHQRAPPIIDCTLMYKGASSALEMSISSPIQKLANFTNK